MESDGLGLVRQKIDRRLYLFWLPVLIRKYACHLIISLCILILFLVAIGLLFVQMFGQPALLKPILDLLPTSHRIPLSA